MMKKGKLRNWCMCILVFVLSCVAVAGCGQGSTPKNDNNAEAGDSVSGAGDADGDAGEAGTGDTDGDAGAGDASGDAGGTGDADEGTGGAGDSSGDTGTGDAGDTGAGDSSGDTGTDNGASSAGLLPDGFYEIGITHQGDLDGDGVAEEIRCELVDRVDDKELHLSVNGTDFYESVLQENYGINPVEAHFYIADIDTEDGWTSVALLYNGPSADPETVFYRYEAGKLTCLGSVEGHPAKEEGNRTIQVRGDGSVAASLGLEVLQTWFAPVDWRLNGEGKLEQVEQEVYYPYADSGIDSGRQIRLLCELPVYEEPGDRNAAQTLMQPQDVKLTATDNKNWCKVEGEDGTEGWFYIEDYGIIVDLGKQSNEVFENLLQVG